MLTSILSLGSKDSRNCWGCGHGCWRRSADNPHSREAEMVDWAPICAHSRLVSSLTNQPVRTSTIAESDDKFHRHCRPHVVAKYPHPETAFEKAHKTLENVRIFPTPILLISRSFTSILSCYGSFYYWSTYFLTCSIKEFNGQLREELKKFGIASSTNGIRYLWNCLPALKLL